MTFFPNFDLRGPTLFSKSAPIFCRPSSMYYVYQFWLSNLPRYIILCLGSWKLQNPKTGSEEKKSIPPVIISGGLFLDCLFRSSAVGRSRGGDVIYPPYPDWNRVNIPAIMGGNPPCLPAPRFRRPRDQVSSYWWWCKSRQAQSRCSLKFLKGARPFLFTVGWNYL